MKRCFAPLLCVLYFLIVFTCHAQVTFTQEELLKSLPADTSTMIVNGSIQFRALQRNRDVFSDFKKVNGKVVVDRDIEISLSESKDLSSPFLYLEFRDIHFLKDVSITVEDPRLNITFEKCIFEGGIFIDGFCQTAAFLDNRIYQSLRTNLKSDNQNLSFVNNEFLPERLGKVKYPYSSTRFGSAARLYEVALLDTLHVYDVRTVGSTDIDVSGSQFVFWRNKTERQITFNIETKHRAIVTENTFLSDLIFSGETTAPLILRANTFKGLVSVENFDYPLSSKIDWSIILNKLAVVEDTLVRIHDIPKKYAMGNVPDTANVFYADFPVRYLYSGDSREMLLNLQAYKNLVYSYKIIFDKFKAKGDVEYANRCFVIVKDLEGQRLKVLNDENGGFRNFFRYRLNRLMKFYTNHATDPALALVISFYIILFFGIFYCFFPSEWDVQSKTRIIANFKDFVRKNDKGYVKPFMAMIYGLAISLANAFALSLNAFVTLGFGNIPTKGVARYVCILQGFLGWFLLSIFTVALFNQVLF